jgi:N-acetylneuraminic acid mutarotase
MLKHTHTHTHTHTLTHSLTLLPALADGEKLYIFGGREGSNGLSDGQPDVQIYDPVANKWTCSGSSAIKPLPTPRTGMGKAAYLGGEFYVMGGEWFPNKHPLVLPSGVFNLVEIYSPKSNTWRQGPAMPQGLHGLHPVVYNNAIYIAGGGSQIDRGTSTTFQVYAPV